MNSPSAFLNFGAGDPAPGWYNVDASPLFRLPRIVHRVLRTCNLCSRSQAFVHADYSWYKHAVSKMLPFPDESFAAIYCSHVFEHMTPDCIRSLFEEFRRVLELGGIIRAVIPDLRRSIERALAGAEAWISLDDALGTMPPILYDNPYRAAAEGWAGFPSVHKSMLNPDRLHANLGDAWHIQNGLGYLESRMDSSLLRAVEREDRCRDAIIFELERRR